MPVISYLRAFCTMRYTRAIYIVAGHEGPDPGDPNGGYVAKINLPGRFYKIEDVNMQIFRDVDIENPMRELQSPASLSRRQYALARPGCYPRTKLWRERNRIPEDLGRRRKLEYCYGPPDTKL
ncbi:hypothetical protein Tco_1445065 [Tanacetum coccineum]